ncbi:MAG TPA: DNA mismatch repair endonuclease MutL [Candidatus Azoamicus sp. OHIO1]
MRINKLPDDVIASIAVGEVIDRPSYVLKELLENSCDSSSTKISVFIENCGLDLIKVIDNGNGIYKEDLYLSISRFTTSKIFNLCDLKSIKTYGFRGEALFYISSISRFELISRTKYQDLAWKIFSDGGKLSIDLEPISRNIGTTVIVKNLFFNSLMKRLFLESLGIEFGFLDFVFKCIALCRFDIQVVLYNNGRELRNYPICSDHYSMIKRIEIICGKKFTSTSIYIDINNEFYSLSGLISTIKSLKTSTNNSYFFLNNRFIDDKLVNLAIKNAYLKFAGYRYKPSYCLYFTISHNLVNINVHPKKTEVKFRDPNVIYEFIYNSLVSYLSNDNKIISILDNCVQFENKKLNDLNLDYSNIFNDIYNNYCSNRKLYISLDGALTLLNNKILFFKIGDDVFVVNLTVVLKMIVIDGFTYEFKSFNRLININLEEFNRVELHIDVNICKYLNDFYLFGFDFEKVGCEVFLLKCIPKILFGFVFDWKSIILELFHFFNSNSVDYIFYDIANENIIFIFLSYIVSDRPYYEFEIQNFYNYLVNLRSVNYQLFTKNCVKVSYSRVE